MPGSSPSRREGSFRAWLSKVCTNVCLTQARSKKLEPGYAPMNSTPVSMQRSAVLKRQFPPIRNKSDAEVARAYDVHSGAYSIFLFAGSYCTRPTRLHDDGLHGARPITVS